MAATGWTLVLVATLLVAGCDLESGSEGAATSTSLPDRSVTDPRPADRFLGRLEGYQSNDSAPVEDEIAALDDAEVAHDDVRRRLIVDKDGYTKGHILFVIFRAGEPAVERFIRAWFGEAERAQVKVGDVEMLRIREHHGASDALVWTGPTFIVKFSRSSEVSEQWLLDLARATVTSAR